MFCRRTNALGAWAKLAFCGMDWSSREKIAGILDCRVSLVALQTMK